MVCEAILSRAEKSAQTKARRREGRLAIEKLELDDIMRKLIKEGWSPASAGSAVGKYHNWLNKVLRSPKAVKLTDKGIDAVWHLHILDTKRYIRDCQNIFGEYLHHDPK